MKKIRLSQSKKLGGTLPLMALVMVLLFTTGMGLLDLGLRGRVLASRKASEISARLAADAGLEKCIFEMNEQLRIKPWNDSVLPGGTNEILLNCGASFSYAAYRGSFGSEPGGGIDGYSAASVGRYHWAEKQVSCELVLKGPFESAIFSDNLLTLYDGTTVDWYNYGAEDQFLAVGTNSNEAGAIDLKSSVTVNGDVVVGVGGDPLTVIGDHGATITGKTYALRQEYDLPPIVVPPWLDSLPIRLPIAETTTITTSGKYGGVNLKAGSILTIDGPVSLYIAGDVILGNMAEIRIVDANTNPDASLTLYLEGNYEGKNGSTINNFTRDPKRLQIFCLDSCISMKFKNSSTFYGAIYAPEADVNFNNSAAAYGAVVAENFSQSNSANFYYDASLRDVTMNDQAVRFVKSKWGEK